MIIGILHLFLMPGFKTDTASVRMTRTNIRMGPAMKSRIYTMICIIVSCCAITCDMFSPRIVERPGSGPSITDPFRLYSILKSTGETFSKTSYEDIFDINFMFTDANLSSYGRAQEIEALRKLIAVHRQDSISTVWDTCNGVLEIHGDHSMTLCRIFKVTFTGASGVVTDSGKTQFELRQSPDNTWTIFKWSEEGQRTVFHP